MKLLRKILDIVFPPSLREQEIVTMHVNGNFPSALPVPHDNMYAAIHYKHPSIRAGIRILKTKHNTIIAKCFGEILHEHILEILQDKEPFEKYTKIILIPMPITKKRLYERGFNQSELIVEHIAKMDPSRYEVKKILRKIKETPKQAVSISKTKRSQNIKGCFACKHKNTERSKTTLYIVVDDVITTGATMTESMKTLARAGYRPVIGTAVAH